MARSAAKFGVDAGPAEAGIKGLAVDLIVQGGVILNLFLRYIQIDRIVIETVDGGEGDHYAALMP